MKVLHRLEGSLYRYVFHTMMSRGLVGDGLQLVGPEVLDLARVLDLGRGRTIALWLERKLYWLLYLKQIRQLCFSKFCCFPDKMSYFNTSMPL